MNDDVSKDHNESAKEGADNQQPQTPKRNVMVFGIAMGVGIGIGLGAALDSMGVGLAIGVAIGVAMGAALRRQQ